MSTSPQTRLRLGCDLEPRRVTLRGGAGLVLLASLEMPDGATCDGLALELAGFRVESGAPSAVRLDFALYRGLWTLLDTAPVAEGSVYLADPATEPREGGLFRVTGTPSDRWHLYATTTGTGAFELSAKVLARPLYGTAGLGLQVEAGPALG